MSRRIHQYGLAMVALLGLACTSPVDAPAPAAVRLTGAGPFVVSNVVSVASLSQGAQGSAAGAAVAFVSLPPGTLTGGTGVTIRVRRTGAEVTAALVEGGLDPVPVPAEVGDTLSLTVTGAGAPAAPWVFTVPPRQPPTLIRTEPRPNRRDVALNARLEVVFSEPIDFATLLPETISLRVGDHLVTGSIEFGNPEHTIVLLRPAAPLDPATQYQLRLGAGIKDLEGTPMESGVTVSFVTASSPPATDPTSFVVSDPAQGVVFVSRAAGAPAWMLRVTIRVRRTGATVTGFLRDGGLDPVAVRAAAGDTISVAGDGGGFWVLTVPAARAPSLVRTGVRNGERDVALNAPLEVVFSEPVDSATLTAEDVRLEVAGGESVPGQLAFANPEHTIVRLTPAALLAPGTDHILTIGTGILDGDLASLSAGASILFSTAPLRPQQLAFVRNDQIHLIKPDGGLLQLTSTGAGTWNEEPSWSPDGKRLAFVTNRYAPGIAPNGAIYVMDADGTNVRQLTSEGYSPAWAPDGHTIVFVSFRNGSRGLYLTDADGDGSSRLLFDEVGWEGQPAWTADGGAITFTSDLRAYDFLFDLYSVGPDGSGLRPLMQGPFYWMDGPTYYFESAWSPDGRRVAVLEQRDGPSPTDPAIAVANADGTDLRVVSRSFAVSGPTWSVDGSTIAFSARMCQGCPPVLRWVRADGSDEGAILSNGFSPAWRPALTQGTVP